MCSNSPSTAWWPFSCPKCWVGQQFVHGTVSERMVTTKSRTGHSATQLFTGPISIKKIFDLFTILHPKPPQVDHHYTLSATADFAPKAAEMAQLADQRPCSSSAIGWPSLITIFLKNQPNLGYYFWPFWLFFHPFQDSMLCILLLFLPAGHHHLFWISLSQFKCRSQTSICRFQQNKMPSRGNDGLQFYNRGKIIFHGEGH